MHHFVSFSEYGLLHPTVTGRIIHKKMNQNEPFTVKSFNSTGFYAQLHRKVTHNPSICPRLIVLIHLQALRDCMQHFTRTACEHLRRPQTWL